MQSTITSVIWLAIMVSHTPYQTYLRWLSGAQIFSGSDHIWLIKVLHYYFIELLDTLYERQHTCLIYIVCKINLQKLSCPCKTIDRISACCPAYFKRKEQFQPRGRQYLYFLAARRDPMRHTLS